MRRTWQSINLALISVAYALKTVQLCFMESQARRFKYCEAFDLGLFWIEIGV